MDAFPLNVALRFNAHYSDQSVDGIDDDIQVICCEITMAHYYDLGVALGWSLRQLDIIQYRAKRKLETASQETVAPKDAIQTPAGATMMGRRVQPTGPLTMEQMKTIWESVQAASKQEQGTNRDWYNGEKLGAAPYSEGPLFRRFVILNTQIVVYLEVR